ncbi:TPA: hypothetical protein N0F65_000783 [Lagenidium giganteum]|uniref:Glycosyl transferase family 1 domain-containing protein n=1 Tax=Lagenidium giganteum TaxID=4803 RepID=A0AAV2ZHR4_9STRA|nr:TPA: hypothetical protein N0F65_000783 [Lagenidium giganteum]
MSSTSEGCLLRVCVFLLLLIVSLVQISFFMLLPQIKIHERSCASDMGALDPPVRHERSPPKSVPVAAAHVETSVKLQSTPMALFYQSLFLSPDDIGFHAREQQRLEARKPTKSPRIRGPEDTTDDAKPVDPEPELKVKSGFFLQSLGQGLEPWNSSAAYCINLITPSNSSDLLTDLDMYMSALPSSRPIHSYTETVVLPPSVIDVYLERHPGNSEYFPDFHVPKQKAIWLMQNVDSFDRHELKNPTVGVMIVKNRIGLQKVLEYRLRHRLQYAVLYTKHTSPDIYDPTVSRDWNAFLHIAGKSHQANTMAILAAWAKHSEWPSLHLYVTAKGLCLRIEDTYGTPAAWDLENVVFKCEEVSDVRRRQLQNQFGVHLYPSESEGFGHQINEARSSGALIVTSNVAPMNELIDERIGVLIGKPHGWWWQTTGDLFLPLARVEEDDVVDGVNRILTWNDHTRQRIGRRARARYLEDRTYFLNVMAALEESLCHDEIRIDKLEPYLY